MSEKRDRERAILRAVYREDEFSLIDHVDRPDFVLQRPDVPPFGVEITELFETEADARLRRHPHYLPRLFEGGPHMHKDDVYLLNVARVDVRDRDGNVKGRDIPAIIRPTPTPRSHFAAVARVISEKDQKAAKYRDTLDHVNLIILDEYARYRKDAADTTSTEDLLADDLRSALLKSRFHEVFLLLRSLNGASYYIQLQLLLLLESYYLFLAALESSDVQRQTLEEHDVTGLFVHVAKSDGRSLPVQAAMEGGSLCAIYRGAAVQYGERGPQVLDLHDHPPPTLLPEPPPLPLSPTQVEHFAAHLTDFSRENRLSTGLHVESVRDPGF